MEGMSSLEPQPGRHMRWGKPPGRRGGSVAVGLAEEPPPSRFSLEQLRRMLRGWADQLLRGLRFRHS
jgi:hypothetical protein